MLKTTYHIIISGDVFFGASYLRAIHDNFRYTQPETVAHYP